jgi:hypothetical protein
MIFDLLLVPARKLNVLDRELVVGMAKQLGREQKAINQELAEEFVLVLKAGRCPLHEEFPNADSTMPVLRRAIRLLISNSSQIVLRRGLWLG